MNENTISSSGRVSVEELLGLLMDSEIDALARELQLDKWVSKLPAKGVLKLILFSIFDSERLSLRVMQEHYRDPFFKFLAPAIASDEVTWVGIRDRLCKIPAVFFQKVYQQVYQQVEALYGSKGLVGYHIKRYDSTMISTFAHLLNGMQVGNTSKHKMQVKFTVCLKDDFLIQTDYYTTQTYLSEENALKASIEAHQQEADEILVFDKGLNRRTTLVELAQRSASFVCRIKDNSRYVLLHPVNTGDVDSDTEQLEFVQDSAVYLYGKSNTPVQTKFRLVQYRIRKNGKTLSLLTNIWDMHHTQIAQVYEKRWDIEVLFRFLKQEMNLSHFVSNHPNAIQVMIYAKMIASMLVLIYKKINNIHSYKHAKIRFFKELIKSIILQAMNSKEGNLWLQNLMIDYAKRE